MKAEFQVTYFLWKARADKNGLAPVYIRSKQNSPKQIGHNTGEKIHPSQWNKKKNEPKNKSEALIELERKLKDTYKDLLQQGYEPDLTLILKHLNEERRPSGEVIASWCDDYLKGQYSEGQKKAVRTLKTNLVGKEPKEGKKVEGFSPSLTFDKLTKPRLKAFFEFLTKQGVANNSAYKRLRALVNVCNHANVNCPDLINYELPYSTANALKTRLTWGEVKSIMSAETKTPMESVAKSVFLLACFSGLRISDLLTLNRGELHQYHYERLQTKTKLPVLVTRHKYNSHLFEQFIKNGVGYSRQRLSDALKEVLKRVENTGLSKEIVKIQAVGYGHKETIKKKYEEISFHSGRRFYSRLLNDLGLGNEVCRDELGHSYKSVTELYSGSQEHNYRVARVRKAMESLEQTLEQLALMKIA